MKPANPINITHIDHVVIRVNNLENMIAFYQDVLGCQLERGPGEAKLAQLRAGQSLIDLVDANGPFGRKGGAAPDQNAPNMDHLCLQLSAWDPEAIQEHLKENKVEFGEIAIRYGALGNGPSLYLRDPEGNTVELKVSPAH
jgi:catechol 2,3-dioxygenase-like lactoylglutathione lyase family enzyme